MLLSQPIHKLKRRAKQVSRARNIPLHAALDEIAVEEGYERWSLLAAKAPATGAAWAIFTRLAPGDLVLVAARPGEGKTLLSLDVAAESMEAGRSAAMFSLEYTSRDVANRLHELGRKPQRFDGAFHFDDSNRICADYVVRMLAEASPGTLVIIDYLQLLDQRRENPPLEDQVRRFKAFASERGLIILFISQIDRSYEPAVKPFPGFEDIRLPNSVDLSLFDKGCFLNKGEMVFQSHRGHIRSAQPFQPPA